MPIKLSLGTRQLLEPLSICRNDVFLLFEIGFWVRKTVSLKVPLFSGVKRALILLLKKIFDCVICLRYKYKNTSPYSAIRILMRVVFANRFLPIMLLVPFLIEITAEKSTSPTVFTQGMTSINHDEMSLQSQVICFKLLPKPSRYHPYHTQAFVYFRVIYATPSFNGNVI